MTRLADRFADALMKRKKKVRRIGDRYEAQCPAHPDRAASLSISMGEDGKLLAYCHAGCTFSEVMAAAGFDAAEAFPTRKVNGNGAHRTPRAWPTLDGAAEVARAIVAKDEGGAVAVGRWMYGDAQGEEVAAVIRFDLPTPADEKQRKSFRPFHRTEAGWVMGDPAGKWPLYRLPEITGCTRVYVCEGEKAADAAVACGLPAMTSAHGAKSARKTDWAAIAGAEVVILPDHDEAGDEYAHAVAAEIRAINPAAVVKVLRLAELAGEGFPKGGDFVEFAGDFRDSMNTDSIREEIEAAAAAVESLPHNSAEAGNSPENADSSPVPVLTCLADVQRKEVSWLWPARIPLGRLTLLVGVPGVGKSFLTSYLTATVSTGRTWTDGSSCPSGSVIIVSAEDDPGDTIGPRCDAHGADSKRIHILSGVMWRNSEGESREVVFSLSNIAALETAMRQLPDLKLIVIDPIGSYLGGKVDGHRDNEVRSVLAPVAALAEKYGVAVVIVCHRRKSAGHSADDMALGSRAFTGIARAVWHLSRDPANKERRLLLPGKNNLSREGDGLAFVIGGAPARLIWEDGPVTMNADEGLAAEQSIDREKPGPQPKARDAATVWLERVLQAGQISATQIKKDAAEAGMNYKTVQRAADDLGVIREKESSFGGVWYWRLPILDTRGTDTPNLKHPVHLSNTENNPKKNDLLGASRERTNSLSLRGHVSTSEPYDPSMEAVA